MPWVGHQPTHGFSKRLPNSNQGLTSQPGGFHPSSMRDFAKAVAMAPASCNGYAVSSLVAKWDEVLSWITPQGKCALIFSYARACFANLTKMRPVMSKDCPLRSLRPICTCLVSCVRKFYSFELPPLSQPE